MNERSATVKQPQLEVPRAASAPPLARRLLGNINNRDASPQLFAPWPDRFEQRSARIERTIDAHRALVPEAKAMCTLDAMTDPAALDSKQPVLAQEVRQLTGYLLGRVMLRASFALHDLPFEPVAEQDEGMRSVATAVEAQFRAAMIAAFPPPTVPGVDVEMLLNVRMFERTFAHFVAGDLRTGRISPVGDQDPLAADGVPDGANFFSFAEAALLFLRLGLAPEFWRPTLRTFVAGNLFFATHHWNRGWRRLDAYTNDRVASPDPGVAGSMLAMVQQFHGALDLPKLIRHHGEVLAMALRDDPRLVRPVSAPEEIR
jgi:hypothetical protein